MRLRLVPDNTQIDFFKARKVTFGVSMVFMVLSLVAWGTMGLNFGIDFRGGTLIRAESTQEVEVAQYRAALQPLELGDVDITSVYDPGFREDQHVVQVRVQAQEGEESITNQTVIRIEEALGQIAGGKLLVSIPAGQADLASADAIANAVSGALSVEVSAAIDGDVIMLTLTEGLGVGSQEAINSAVHGVNSAIEDISFRYKTLSFPNVESVGPEVSGELVQGAVIAVLAALGAIMVYIWLRFEWQFSLGAVVALFHDVLLTIGIFSVLQIRFDLATIAALLTIVGYSINDTVVIFDRVRENLIKYKKMPLQDVMNLSVNETLARTVMTSGTTLIALIALLVLGGDVIRGFVFAITWGVIVGTYSSVYVAKNVVLMLGTKRDWSKPSDGGPGGTQFSSSDA